MTSDRSSVARRARALYARSQHGILSTISLEISGFPFGSVVSFAPDRQGRPLLLISRIAEHTHNVAADNRVSLTLAEPGEDPQAAGRLTLVGRAQGLPAGEQAGALRRYERRFPQAADWRRAHDFDLFRIEPLRIRYIGGFGQIHWLEPGELCVANPFTDVVEEGMLGHMNRDHATALRDYCRMFDVDVGAIAPQLSAIDGEGFDLMAGKRLVRIDFSQPVASADDVRKAMVALALQAREIGLQAAPA